MRLHILESSGGQFAHDQKIQRSIVHLFGAKVHIVKIQGVGLHIFKMLGVKYTWPIIQGVNCNKP